MNTREFVPGLVLNRRFYHEVVRPLLEHHMPGLRHSAGLSGYGSDVLGYDTPMSTDHNWGPRLHLYLSQEDHAKHAAAINKMLRQHLPAIFLGYSVHFSTPDLADGGTQRGTAHPGGEVNHLISIGTVEGLFKKYLNIEPFSALFPVDWLALPEQKLLEATAGETFHDGLGTLNAARARFAYYPREVWKVKLAAQWQRLSEEEAFVGRTGDLGDEVGSWIISARLARGLMQLAFLYARRYAPYNKWLGTAFARVPMAPAMMPHLQGLVAAQDWRARETHLSVLYTHLATIHNLCGLTEPLSTQTRDYFGRPFQVLFAGRFADAISATINDPALQRLAHIGAVDQFTDNVAVHSNAAIAAKLKHVYTSGATA